MRQSATAWPGLARHALVRAPGATWARARHRHVEFSATVARCPSSPRRRRLPGLPEVQRPVLRDVCCDAARLGDEYLANDRLSQVRQGCLGKRDLVHELLQTHWGMVFHGGGAAGRAIWQGGGGACRPSHGAGGKARCTRATDLEKAVKLVDCKFENVASSASAQIMCTWTLAWT